MSVYKVIKTQIKNGESLARALTELGIVFQRGSSLTNNGVTLKTNWGSNWGGADQQVAIAIAKQIVDAVRDAAAAMRAGEKAGRTVEREEVPA